MTDDDIQHSGSRWEPTPGSGPEFGPYAPSVPVETGPYAATATAVSPAVGTGDRAAPAGKGLLAAIAAGFLLIGGVGGFAVGHATSGNGGAGTASLQSGFAGPGGQGGSGELPGRRFDRDGDHGGGFDGAPGAPLNGTSPGDGSGAGTLPGGQGSSTGGGNDDGPTT